jgi:hypothetical protein
MKTRILMLILLLASPPQPLPGPKLSVAHGVAPER